ncbi:MAG TPA: hypothetical protein VFE43_04710 [Candidatus Binataceae bacterium]|jgi:hypothetical protein|nr:hypothetical protein [Candidatus Binataceae bacterium]
MRPRGGDLGLVVIAAMMGAAAYFAVRNMALAVIASTVPLCRHAMLALEDKRHDNPPAPVPRRLVNELMVGAIALLLAVTTGLFSRTLPDGYSQPHGAVEFMQAHGARGNVLCDFGWGEYLIFHLAPESRVFVDSRYDMVYPQKVLADYFDFKFDRPRAATVLDAYPHDYLLITPASPVRELMERRLDWRLIYRDPDALLFAHANSAAARIGGVPIRGQQQPETFP